MRTGRTCNAINRGAKRCSSGFSPTCRVKSDLQLARSLHQGWVSAAPFDQRTQKAGRTISITTRDRMAHISAVVFYDAVTASDILDSSLLQPHNLKAHFAYWIGIV